MTSGAQRAVDAVWRIESPRLIAGLTRMVRDLGIAEDLAQDALVAALEAWPQFGVPANPGAWLMAVAKRRAIDRFRREELGERKLEEIGRTLRLREDEAAAQLDDALDDEIGDDLLRLVFIACHPVLPQAARVALTLRLLGGLETGEIARAFFVPEATVAQRIVRAKRTLAAARIPFEVPRADERTARLASVLEVLYLIFNEGYCATAGDDWVRLALCEDALRMGRVVAELMPQNPEVHGLVSLMEIQASRTAARTAPNGDPILLLEQGRARWNQVLVRRGLEALERAERARRQLRAVRPASRDRRLPRAGADRRALRRSSAIAASPVVALNRAVAVGIGYGPAAGLEALEELRAAPALQDYYLLASVRGDLLDRLGRAGEARSEFERAAQLTNNARERRLLLARAASQR